VAASDVIVIGGGIIGCTVAWRLAREGARVTIIERSEPGAEASSAAAGQLVPEAGRYGGNDALLDHWLAALRMYPDYVASIQEATGMSFEYRTVGRLAVAYDDDDLEELQAHHSLQQVSGVRSELWTARQLLEAEPALTQNVRGALLFPDHGIVDNRRLTRCVAIAAQRRGVQLRTGKPVSGLLTHDDKVIGVDVCGERLAAGAVVVAAGSWSGLVDARFPVPVTPAKGQILALDVHPPIVRHIVGSHGGTLTPRTDGRLIVAATVEDAGYDKRNTASAIHQLLANAVRMCPALAQAPIQEIWAGLRPVVTADHLPVVGAAASPGLFYATGHYTMGILSAPATAEALTGLIVDGESPLPIEAFSPSRFFR
jgi:glycine oxidase